MAILFGTMESSVGHYGANTIGTDVAEPQVYCNPP